MILHPVGYKNIVFSKFIPFRVQKYEKYGSTRYFSYFCSLEKIGIKTLRI